MRRVRCRPFYRHIEGARYALWIALGGPGDARIDLLAIIVKAKALSDQPAIGAGMIECERQASQRLCQTKRTQRITPIGARLQEQCC